MERVKKNQENISSASRFIHFGLLQRIRPLLFTCSPVFFFFSCENKIYFQATFVVHAVSACVISDDFQKLPLQNFTFSCNPSLLFPDVTNGYIQSLVLNYIMLI